MIVDLFPMAARNIARVVDWVALSSKVPHNSRAEISALRSAYEAARQKFVFDHPTDIWERKIENVPKFEKFPTFADEL